MKDKNIEEMISNLKLENLEINEEGIKKAEDFSMKKINKDELITKTLRKRPKNDNK